MDIIDFRQMENTTNQELPEILESLQKYISRNYANLLQNNDKKNDELLLSYIVKYISDNKITHKKYDINSLAKRLLNEMIGFSFLSEFLSSERKDIEEINITQWNDVKITDADGRVYSLEEKFFSPQHAIDVVRRLLQASNIVWDKAQCLVVGHLGNNIRITVVGFDVVDKEKGLSVSIRIVNPKKFTREEYISGGTATAEMLDFLAYSFVYGISMCLTGAASSGKTTLMSWILDQIPYNKRLITIEQECREFDCVKYDEKGLVLNSVIHLITRFSKDAEQNITQVKLLETILTMNPDYIAVAESKGEEAMQAINAANTGHGVITTTHANSCEDTYYRLLSLCKMKYVMDDTNLLNLATKAFPIVCFCKHLEDNSRRIMEISEREYSSDGNHKMRTLYRYNIRRTSKIDGATKIEGEYEKVNNPSETLLKTLRNNGLPVEIEEKLFADLEEKK